MEHLSKLSKKRPIHRHDIDASESMERWIRQDRVKGPPLFFASSRLNTPISLTTNVNIQANSVALMRVDEKDVEQLLEDPRLSLEDRGSIVWSGG